MKDFVYNIGIGDDYMFKKNKKKESLNVNKEHYSVAIIDYLRRQEPTKTGVKALLLTMFEKNYFLIDEKIVNLGTPWEPNEQNIIQLSLSASINPDKVTELEDHMINWVLFTLGDGVYTNITQVYDDINKNDFIQAHDEMYQGYKTKVLNLAKDLNLVDTEFGNVQKKYYKKPEESTSNSKRLVYNQSIDVNPLIQKMLDLFDQTL